jgi:hypothetical protein
VSEPIKPALTPENWFAPKVLFRKPEFKGDEGYGVELIRSKSGKPTSDWCTVFDGSWAVTLENDARHALAALALHNQPFGFTREDVKMLRESQIWADSTDLRVNGEPADFEDLADRIEALLPPEEK